MKWLMIYMHRKHPEHLLKRFVYQLVKIIANRGYCICIF
jgi:hypothetical protein